jgi:hypothetical protein
MAYNPTPSQKHYQRCGGSVLRAIGIIVFVFGLIASPLDTTTMLVGAILASAGQLMMLFAE